MRALGLGALAGLAAGAAMVLVTMLLRRLAGVPLPAELVSDRVLPLVPVERFLDLLNRLGGPIQAKQIAYWSAFAGQVLTGAALGALLGGLTARARRRPPRLRPEAVLGIVLVAILAVALAALWPELDASYRGLPPGRARIATIGGLVVAFAAFGAALVGAHRLLTRPRVAPAGAPPDDGGRLGRRAFLVAGAGAVAGLGALGVARDLYRRGTFSYDGRSLRAGDLSHVTPTDRFYVVTKNLIDPRVDVGAWRLGIDGAVERPATHTLDELRAMPRVAQVQTLECISNSVGGGLISNAEWSGVRLADLLVAARPRPDAVQVMLHGVDGYTHAMSLERAMRPVTLLALDMNGRPLDDRHGRPVRLLAPGAYGEMSVKWITRVEVRDSEAEGYYGRQGWEAGRVRTMSRFFGLRDGDRLAPGAVELTGVAFAGDRGIRAVEVSVDDGATWTRARIDYSPSPLAWTVWALPWRARPGVHALVVRAIDGEGVLQTDEERGIAPSGASGRHRIEVTVA